MEKYARQAISEGLQRSEDIHVNKDSEIYRVLNLHYNRNNHIEVSTTNPPYTQPLHPPTVDDEFCFFNLVLQCLPIKNSQNLRAVSIGVPGRIPFTTFSRYSLEKKIQRTVNDSNETLSCLI